MPGRKVEDAGSQPVNVHLGISLDEPLHPPRLLPEHEPRCVNRVTANVHQSPASILGNIADVGRVSVEVAEETDDRT